MLKGSTEHAFEVALPQLIEMDALRIPSTLEFGVPAIPKDDAEGLVVRRSHGHAHSRFREKPAGYAGSSGGVLLRSEEGQR